MVKRKSAIFKIIQMVSILGLHMDQKSTRKLLKWMHSRRCMILRIKTKLACRLCSELKSRAKSVG